MLRPQRRSRSPASETRGHHHTTEGRIETVNVYVGVDPGKKGGIAGIDEAGKLLFALRMPVTGTTKDDDYNVDAIVDYISRATHIAIEKQMPIPPLGEPCRVCHRRPSQGTASIMKQGQGFGMLIGVAAATKCPRTIVAPQTWQKEMLADKPKGRDAIEAAKLSRARELWPGTDFFKFKADQGVADAALLAEYCRRRAGILESAR